MAKYICAVCGYVYDEDRGVPEAGIAPGTRWETLPDDWGCPVCGAPKSEFVRQGQSAAPAENRPAAPAAVSGDEHELTPQELRVLCDNLARGCEKQYKTEEQALFRQLADFFAAAAAPAEAPDTGSLLTAIGKDLSEGFPAANAVSAEDRGALRALVWSEKVTRILKSLLTRYEKEGDAMLENTGVYVCTICGFVFIGDRPPELCPVCKVPGWKFEKVEGR